MKDTATVAAKNKRIRQEALREQLASQKHVEHAVEIIRKLADEDRELDAGMVNRYRIALDGKFKLIDKYLPTDKPVSIEGADGGPIVVTWQQ